jgi:hypothetical protein
VTKALARRQILRASLGIAAGAGLAVAGLVDAAPAAAAPVSQLPDVPGMLGDRRANEFWFQFDEAMGYTPTTELMDAYLAIGDYLGGNVVSVFHKKWFELAAQPDYPRNFTAYVTPIAGPLAVLSRYELAVFDQFYCHHDPKLFKAFAYFGQGVLFDPRRADVGAPVHTMDGTPPTAYHTWHVCIRAMTLLGIDKGWWREISPLVGFAWAVQSVAKPSILQVNPPLPADAVRRLADTWLPKSPRRLDQDFQSFPYPPGIA